MSKNPPLVVVVGETASGKSSLGLQLAQQFDGEIICADSRTIYKGMDISTAKPSPAERKIVPHYLLDVVEPGTPFTVADFKVLAEQAIEDITARGKLPIMVGGSGLYVDAVLYDYQFKPKSGNGDQAADRQSLRPNSLTIGLRIDRDDLRTRIAERVDAMLAAGLTDEIKELLRRFGPEAEALRTPAIKAFRGYIEGRQSLETARQQFIQNDIDLAKRQRTWFKRNKGIHWFTTPVNQTDVVDLVTTFLADKIHY